MYLFILYLITLPLEYLLAVDWNTIYFRTGIPIYRHSWEVVAKTSPPPAFLIEGELPDSNYQMILIAKIDANRYAFREQLWRFAPSYTPIMRGLLTYKRQEGRLIVTGYLYLWTLFFVAMSGLILFIALNWSPFTLIIGLFPIVIYRSIYITQARRFREVGQVAADLWAEGNYDENASYKYRETGGFDKPRVILFIAMIVFIYIYTTICYNVY